MTVRVWRARASALYADAYADHFRTVVLPELRELAGFRDASLLRRDAEGGVAELLVLTRWDSLDAIRRFAGDDIERAVVAPAARALLLAFDDRVAHYDEVPTD